jgi:hypothetical protein
MTVLTNKGAGFESVAATVRSFAPIEASTIDVATVELLLDDDFMARFHQGVAEFERGELRSFEDIFGEPL